MAHLVVLFLLVFLCSTEGKEAQGKNQSHHENIMEDADKAPQNIESLSGPYEGFMKYGGCYKTSKVSIKETRTDNYNNNNECITFCDELGFKIIATSGEKCYCLEKSPSPQDDVEGCDKRCPDSLIEVPGSCSGYDCCGGEDKVSVYSRNSMKRNYVAKRTSDSTNIQGCFNDEVTNILSDPTTVKRRDSRNTLLRCNAFCLEKGFPVASLRSDHCYCTNVLPLTRLYTDVDGSKECNLFCAGVLGKSGKCIRDQCCGGQEKNGRHTYTVFISGTLDILKQLLRRVQVNFRYDAGDFGKKVFGKDDEDEYGIVHICPDGWHQYNHFCYQINENERTFYEAKEDCEKKGGHLFIVPTEEYRRLWNSRLGKIRRRSKLSSWYIPSFIEKVWVGLEWNESKNRWDWMNGMPLNTKIEHNSRPSKGYCPMFKGSLAQPQRRLTAKGQQCREKAPYVCQAFVSITASGLNPVGGKNDQKTFQSLSMQLAFPEIIMAQRSLANIDQKDKVVTMAVEELEEKIKKEMSPSTEFLAGSDVVYRNKDSDAEGKFIYQHTLETSNGVTVTKSSGGSIAVSVGTEFETKTFFTGTKILASVVGTGSWESGKETYNSKTVTHSYTFEFPVPGGCDATIAVMKNELPTRIDWRASFYSSGWMEVKIGQRKKFVDVTRLLKNNQRFFYSFGTNDFGARPTIVPVKTLVCKGKDKPKQEVLKKCTDPETKKAIDCVKPVGQDKKQK